MGELWFTVYINFTGALPSSFICRLSKAMSPDTTAEGNIYDGNSMAHKVSKHLRLGSTLFLILVDCQLSYVNSIPVTTTKCRKRYMWWLWCMCPFTHMHTFRAWGMRGCLIPWSWSYRWFTNCLTWILRSKLGWSTKGASTPWLVFSILSLIIVACVLGTMQMTIWVILPGI